MDDQNYSDYINAELLRLGNRQITNDMIIAIDRVDTNKPCVKAMEHLCDVYDGSFKNRGSRLIVSLNAPPKY